MFFLVRAFQRAVAQMAIGKTAHGVAELLLFGGKVEIHDMKPQVEETPILPPGAV
jgi:hypothetical protein